jgi:hypothetical protein
MKGPKHPMLSSPYYGITLPNRTLINLDIISVPNFLKPTLKTFKSKYFLKSGSSHAYHINNLLESQPKKKL